MSDFIYHPVFLPVLAIVIPCYYEEEVLMETNKRLNELIKSLISNQQISEQSYILYIDDGSKDRTWRIISELHKDKGVKGIKLSRNFGHQNALIAGLHHVSDADICISIDADLQDDIMAIKEMVKAYANGFDVVYGVRDDRTTDTRFKRNTAQLFYKILKVMGVETVYNHADYRLMSKRALESFLQFDEYNLYIRGIVPLVGYNSTEVYYQRGARFAGESKYNLKKMLSFAWNGISSMSIKPLRFVSFCGFTVFVITLLLGAYALFSYWNSNVTPGWSSTVIPMYFLGGIQLLCIGLIGEYLAKIYQEIKKRPKFIIEQKLN